METRQSVFKTPIVQLLEKEGAYSWIKVGLEEITAFATFKQLRSETKEGSFESLSVFWKPGWFV